MKLSIKAFALAGGVFWGVCFGVWTLVLATTSIKYGLAFHQLFVGTYPYYAITPTGALVGLVFGFIDGFVIGAVFAWLYNLFLGKKA